MAPPARGPTPVGIVVLTHKPVTITSEYVGVLKSRRSSEVRPQVEGIITQIFVKSGDRVAPGRALLQIDPRREQAALESNQASRVAQEAAVRFAEQQFERAKQLLEAGATSQQEFEQAETNLNTAKAALEALKAREREAGVQLQYFRVTSPTGGRRRRHPRARRRPRDDLDRAHHRGSNRPASRPTSRFRSSARPSVRVGLPVRLMDAQGEVLAETADRLRVAAGGRPHAVGAGEGAGAGQPGLPHRAVRAGAGRLAQRAGPDCADYGRHPHQRAVLRVCRRTGRERVRRAPARREGRRAARQRLRPSRGPQGRRSAHRVRRAEESATARPSSRRVRGARCSSTSSFDGRSSHRSWRWSSSWPA